MDKPTMPPTDSRALELTANIQVAGSTVYVSNDHYRPSNLWAARVQPGFDGNGHQLSEEDCELIAQKIAAVLSAAPQSDGGEPHCSYVGRAEGTYFCSWLPGKELDTRWRVTERFEYTHFMLPQRASRRTPCGHLPLTTCRLCEGPQTPPDWVAPVSAAQQAPEQQATVEWKPVPAEPTPAMLHALWQHRDAMRGMSENKIARESYRAMLAAAPIQQEAAEPRVFGVFNRCRGKDDFLLWAENVPDGEYMLVRLADLPTPPKMTQTEGQSHGE